MSRTKILVLFSLVLSFALIRRSTLLVSAQDQFGSPYGFNLGGHFNYDYPARKIIPGAEFDNVASLISEGGAKWVRVMVFWKQLQPKSKNEWEKAKWEYLSNLMTTMRNHGLTIDLVVTEVPRWANNAPSTEVAAGYPPINMADWDQFISKLVQKLEEDEIKIGAWEIENEIDGNTRTGYREHPEKYVEMFTRAVPIIRNAQNIHEQDKAFIMPSGFFNIHYAKEDIIYWLNHLPKDYIAGLSFHTYGPDDAQILQYWNKFLTARNDAGLGNKPVWLTETNLNDQPKGYLDPEASQKLPKRIDAFLQNGAQKVFWYCESNGFWGAGILKIQNFSTVPHFVKNEAVFSAYQEMTGVAAKTPIKGDLNSDGEVNEIDRDILKSRYLTNDTIADIDLSGLVDATDYLILVSNFGESQ